MHTGSTARVTEFTFDPTHLAEIEALMRLTGVGTKKEFLNNALALLVWAIEKRQKGRAIAAVDEAAGTYEEFTLPVLDATPITTNA